MTGMATVITLGVILVTGAIVGPLLLPVVVVAGTLREGAVTLAALRVGVAPLTLPAGIMMMTEPQGGKRGRAHIQEQEDPVAAVHVEDSIAGQVSHDHLFAVSLHFPSKRKNTPKSQEFPILFPRSMFNVLPFVDHLSLAYVSCTKRRAIGRTIAATSS